MKVIKSIFRFISLLFLFAGSVPVFATIRGAPVYVKTVAQPNGAPKKYVRTFFKDLHRDYYSGLNTKRQEQQLFNVLKRCSPYSVKVVVEDAQTYDGQNAALKHAIQQWRNADKENQNFFVDPKYSTCQYLIDYSPMACLIPYCRTLSIPYANIEFRHLQSASPLRFLDYYSCRPETIEAIKTQYDFINNAQKRDSNIIPKNLFDMIQHHMSGDSSDFAQLCNSYNAPFTGSDFSKINLMSDPLIDALMYYHIDLMEKENVEYGFFALGSAHIEGLYKGTSKEYSLDEYMAARGYIKAADNDDFPFTPEQRTNENIDVIRKWVVENPRDIEADLAPFIPGGSYAFPVNPTQKSSKEQSFATLEAQILALKQHSAAINQKYDDIEKDHAEIAAGIERLKQGTAQVNATVNNAQQSITHTTKMARSLVRNTRRPANRRPRGRASAAQVTRRVPRQRPSQQKRRPTTKAVRATIAKKAAASRMHRARKKVARRGNQRGRAQVRR